MGKFKVEFIQSQVYVIDVEARTEEEAKDKASKRWNEVCEGGTYHYHEVGDPLVEVGTVYDVTNTDDPFNP